MGSLGAERNIKLIIRNEASVHESFGRGKNKDRSLDRVSLRAFRANGHCREQGAMEKVQHSIRRHWHQAAERPWRWTACHQTAVCHFPTARLPQMAPGDYSDPAELPEGLEKI